MPYPYNAPGLSPQFQAEGEDFNAMNEVPRQVLDPRSLALRRQANPRSAFYAQQDEDRSAQHQRNVMGVKANAFHRNLSQRDMEWRQMQQDREWKRSMVDREFAQRESETKYQRDREAKMDQRSEKETAIAAAMRMVSSNDPVTRAKGEVLLERLSGGESSPQAGGGTFTQQAQEGLVGPQVGPMAQGSQDPRIAQAMEERKALQRAAEEDREFKKAERGYGFQKQQADAAEAAHEKRNRTKLDFLKAALAETEDPTERAALMNQAASIQASLPQLVNKPRGMMGMGDVAGEALQKGYDAADQSGQAAAGNTFKVDKFKQASYDRKRKMGESQEVTQMADQAISSDPVVAGKLAELEDLVSSAQKEGFWSKIDRTVYNLILKSPGDYLEQTIDDPTVADIKARTDAIAREAASRLQVDEATVRSLIVNRLRKGAPGSDTQVGRQIRGALSPSELRSPF